MDQDERPTQPPTATAQLDSAAPSHSERPHQTDPPPSTAIAVDERDPKAESDATDGRLSDQCETIVTDLEPVAYRFESANALADSWEQIICVSPQAVPDATRDDVRNITPLVPLPQVEDVILTLLREQERTHLHEREERHEKSH